VVGLHACRSLRGHPPEGPRDLLEGTAGLVRSQTVPQQGDDVGAHLRIGNEVAVAEEVCRPAHLADVDCAQQGKRFDLVSAEGRRDDPPEPSDASRGPRAGTEAFCSATTPLRCAAIHARYQSSDHALADVRDTI